MSAEDLAGIRAGGSSDGGEGEWNVGAHRSGGSTPAAPSPSFLTPGEGAPLFPFLDNGNSGESDGHKEVRLHPRSRTRLPELVRPQPSPTLPHSGRGETSLRRPCEQHRTNKQRTVAVEERTLSRSTISINVSSFSTLPLLPMDDELSIKSEQQPLLRMRQSKLPNVIDKATSGRQCYWVENKFQRDELRVSTI